MSPVFHREEGYVFKVHSNEEERKHIHVIKAECEAKFWLEPEIELEWNEGFKSQELKKILNIIRTHGSDFKVLYTKHTAGRIDD